MMTRAMLSGNRRMFNKSSGQSQQSSAGLQKMQTDKSETEKRMSRCK